MAMIQERRELTDNPEYKKVTSIEEPGVYFIVPDPRTWNRDLDPHNEHHFRFLPEDLRDLIGHSPAFGANLAFHFRNDIQDIRSLRYSNGILSNQSEWLGMTDESSSISYGNDVYNARLRIPDFIIQDAGVLTAIKGTLQVIPDESRNGFFGAALYQYFPNEKGVHTFPHWMGALRYEGDKPGELIQAALKHVNRSIDSHNLPLWKAHEG